MGILNHIIKQAQSGPKSIVLAEGDDIRIVEAAVRASGDGIAECILIGNSESIQGQAADAGLTLAVHEVMVARDGSKLCDPHGVPYTFALRRILEECSTV
ncbi:MAG: phosphate acyltransferase, partial [Gammaproteobacteria bacterium]